MEVKEAIEKRRSIRKYKDKKVSQEIIDELIEAARLAPSAYHSQPWKFKVVSDKEVIDKFRKEKVFKQDFVCNAPLIIVPCGLVSCYPERAGENFDINKLVAGDISISCQNLVLRGTEFGLGSCYVGLVDFDKLKNLLDIPQDYFIPYVIPIGFPDEDPGEKVRKSKEEILL